MFDRILPASRDRAEPYCLSWYQDQACTGAERPPPPTYGACLGRPREGTNVPTNGEATAWSCTVLAYTITEEDYGGETLNAEIMGALQSSLCFLPWQLLKYEVWS